METKRCGIKFLLFLDSELLCCGIGNNARIKGDYYDGRNVDALPGRFWYGIYDAAPINVNYLVFCFFNYCISEIRQDIQAVEQTLTCLSQY